MKFFLGHRLPLGFFGGVRFGLSDFSSRSREEPATIEYCYVIRNTRGLVKIGSSNDPERRRRELQTGSPYALEIVGLLATDIDPEIIEKRAHRILASMGWRDEWFAATPAEALWALKTAAYGFGLRTSETNLERLQQGIIDFTSAQSKPPIGNPLDSWKTWALITVLTFSTIYWLLQ